MADEFHGSWVVICLAMASCSPGVQCDPLPEWTVFPGVGIPNVCQLGMTAEEVCKTNKGAVSICLTGQEWRSECSLVVPSTAAIGHIPSGNPTEPIETITFYTQPYKHGVIAGVEINVPFRGKINQGPSFGQGSVRRRDIENCFGVINNHATNLVAISALSQTRQPFWWSSPWGTDELWYPDKGISFSLRSNVVISLEVFRPDSPTTK
jgi:hypothetical protein